jgi:hypothetical protein
MMTFIRSPFEKGRVIGLNGIPACIEYPMRTVQEQSINENPAAVSFN